MFAPNFMCGLFTFSITEPITHYPSSYFYTLQNTCTVYYKIHRGQQEWKVSFFNTLDNIVDIRALALSTSNCSFMYNISKAVDSWGMNGHIFTVKDSNVPLFLESLYIKLYNSTLFNFSIIFLILYQMT